ncbi:MAG TPA: DNA polymerase [Nitrosospira sp.]
MDYEEPCIAVNEQILEVLSNTPASHWVAHNAQFEWTVINTILARKYGLRPTPIEKFICTMAAGYAMALPGSLDEMSAALGIAEGKDQAGSRLAVQMSKPRRIENGQPIWWDEPEKQGRLHQYCKQDIRVEREVYQRVRALSTQESHLWHVDIAINQRGVYIDGDAAPTALAIVEREQAVRSIQLWSLTGGAVDGPSQVAKLKTWLEQQGVAMSGLAKQEVIDALVTDTLPAPAREALELRQAFAKTSTAKISRMLQCRGEGGRVRGMLQFHGTGTGRWAGRLIQPQNLPRPTIEQDAIEDILQYCTMYDPATAAEYIRVFYGSPLARIADCLRGLICAAPGHLLYAGDYSNIEGRVLAWLAGEEWKVKAFEAFDAGTGPDLYLLAAARIFHKPVTAYTKKSPERQIGKVAELALGYQGGVGAFQTMAVTYGVKVSDSEAESIKLAWRGAHPCITQFWYDLEAAAVRAVQNPGLISPCRNVSFRIHGSFLWCCLPSGRLLCYPYPELQDILTPWGDMKPQVSYKAVDDTTRQWTRTHTYGGKLAENITQAVARDILAHALIQLHANGWPIVLHVHDEIVAEVQSGGSPRPLEEFLAAMKQSPPWAAGLPIAVEGWKGRRYRK